MDPSPRVMEIKAKINKWDKIKLKSFCTTKDTTNETKRQITEWEKMFINDKANRALFPKYTKQLLQLNNKNTQVSPIKKWTEDLNRQFSKKGHADDQKAREKMLNTANY